MARTRVIIDTDPGVDDAIAILLALASDELEVLALTTVSGNVNVDRTTLNARRLLELAQRPDIPVARGCAEPLVGSRDEASDVHGRDGLGDLEWDEPTIGEYPGHAVDLQRALIEQGPLTIVAIGPLTNLALLVERYPGIDEKVERVVIMGGASFHGNVTAAAEFNIWFDPEAAERVFAASWPITLMPLDLTHQAVLNDEDLAFLRALGTVVGSRCADMLMPYAAFHEQWYGNRDVIMHDATAVYELLDPSAIAKQGVQVAIETAGEHSRGATVIDRRREFVASDCRVGVDIDNESFVALVRERLSRYR
ncbi:MAG TPA: nucleoside hydrolase [Acidimicrobiales bacterium]|nr:nucleoside hydrolase [Acidimicrobiales bacterium]